MFPIDYELTAASKTQLIEVDSVMLLASVSDGAVSTPIVSGGGNC